MRVAAIQMDLAWEDPAANRERAAERLARAAAQGAELAVLPEVFATGFSMRTAATAEPVGGPLQRFLSEQAAEHGLAIVTTVAIQMEDKPHNTAVVVDREGEVIDLRPKVHPFTYAREHEHFGAGDDRAVHPLGDHVLGTAVCYDLRFPELFRDLTSRGATLLVIPANWPDRRSHAWSQLLVARAIENQCFVVGVNRVGTGGDLTYDGRSALVDPLGHVLATAVREDTILLADLPRPTVDRVRDELPFLEDVRADLWPCLFRK